MCTKFGADTESCNCFRPAVSSKSQMQDASNDNSIGACLWGHTSDLVPVCPHAMLGSVLDMLRGAGCANVGCCSNNEIPAVLCILARQPYCESMWYIELVAYLDLLQTACRILHQGCYVPTDCCSGDSG